MTKKRNGLAIVGESLEVKLGELLPEIATHLHRSFPEGERRQSMEYKRFENSVRINVTKDKTLQKARVGLNTDVQDLGEVSSEDMEGIYPAAPVYAAYAFKHGHERGQVVTYVILQDGGMGGTTGVGSAIDRGVPTIKVFHQQFLEQAPEPLPASTVNGKRHSISNQPGLSIPLGA